MPIPIEPQGPEPLARSLQMMKASRQKRGSALGGGREDFLDIMSEMASRDSESGTDVGRGMSSPVQPDRGTPALMASMGQSGGGGPMSRQMAQVTPVSGRFNLFGGGGGGGRKSGGCYRDSNGQMVCPTQGESQIGMADGQSVVGGMPMMTPQTNSGMQTGAMPRKPSNQAPASSPNQAAAPNPATPMGQIMTTAQNTGDDKTIRAATSLQDAYRFLQSIPEGSPTYYVAAASILAIESAKNYTASLNGIESNKLATRAAELALEEKETNIIWNQDLQRADLYKDPESRQNRINAAMNGGQDNFGNDYAFQTKNQRIQVVVQEQMSLNRENIGSDPENIRRSEVAARQLATASVLGHDLARDLIYNADNNPRMPKVQTDVELTASGLAGSTDREDMDKAVFLAYADVTQNTLSPDGKSMVEGKPLRDEELMGYMRVNFADSLRIQFHQQLAIAYMDDNGKLPEDMTPDYLSKISSDAANMVSDSYAQLISESDGRIAVQQQQQRRQQPESEGLDETYFQ